MSKEKAVVTVVIPTRNKFNFLKNCIFALRKNAGIPFEVIVVDGGDDDTWEWLKEQKILGIRAEKEWNFAKINNEAMKVVDTEYALLLNNDTLPKPNFLAEMMNIMEAKDKCAIVGAKLLFPDGSIQHVGISFDAFAKPYHIYYKAKDNQNVWVANRDDEFNAVTGACLLIKKAVWDEVGGMNEDFWFNYEDVDLCLKVREKGYKIWFSHKAVVTHFEGMSLDDRIKDPRFSVPENFKLFSKIWVTSDKIQNIIHRKIDTKRGAFRDDLLNIAFVPANPNVGISYWRMMLPASKLQEKDLANVEVIRSGRSIEDIEHILYNSDVSIFQAYFNEPILDIAKQGADRPFKMVYEFDDHPVYLSPFASVYKHLGTQEVKYEIDGEPYWLWRDGEHGFYIEENVRNKTRQLLIISECDHVLTTTSELSNYFETKNKNVTAITNHIDFNVFKPLPLRKNNEVRIGWHGGDNHYHDIYEVGKELTKFVNERDNVKLVIFGNFYKGAFQGIDMNKVEEHGWVHIEAFPYKLAGLNVDVAVIPLADEAKFPFNKYKSDLKYCEYSSLQIPSLVEANRIAYKDCIDGENSLTFATNVEFNEKLEQLVGDADFRQTLGKQAYDWCYEYRNLDKGIYKWLDVFKSVAGEGNGDSRSGLRTGTATSELRTTEGGDS